MRGFLFFMAVSFIFSIHGFCEVFEKDYVLGPSDKLQVQVSGPITWSASGTIYPDGKIGFENPTVIPAVTGHVINVVAQLSVDGLNMEQAQMRIEEDLLKYFKDIHVRLLLVQSRFNVYVGGEFKSPGSYTFVPGKSLVDYFGLAGGPLSSADFKKGRVVRMQDGKRIEIKTNFSDVLTGKSPFVVQPGDWLYVPPTKRIVGFRDYLNLLITVIPTVATIIALTN